MIKAKLSIDGKESVISEITDKKITVNIKNVIVLISNIRLVKAALNLKPIICSKKRKICLKKGVLRQIF